MLKLILTAAIVGTLAVPALAAEMKCDEATMASMDKMMMGMKDMGTKAKAMKEMDMAKDAMKMNKMDDCKRHMNNALRASPVSSG